MKKFIYTIGLLSLPSITLAASNTTAVQGTLGGVLGTIKGLMDSIIPIIIVGAVIYFFYGVAKYVMAAGDEDAQTAGRSVMIYGIIGLFVIVAVWGLVGLLGTTFGINIGGPAPTLPYVPSL